MNIVHMGCPYLPYLGGSTKRLMALASEIYKFSGVKQYLITPTISSSEKDDLYFFDVLRLKDINSYFFKFTVCKFIKKVKADIVVLHNSRVVLTWFLYYRFVFPNAKVVIEIHSFRDDSALKKIINKNIYNCADRIVHLSESSRLYMEMEYEYLKNSVVYNGVQVKLTNDLKNYDPNNVVYGYIGSFHSWQGTRVIVDNVLNIEANFWNENELHLVGDGPDYEYVVSKLQPLINQGAKIYIYGWKNSSFISNLASKFDFLLAPRPSTVATETVFPLKIVDSINYNIPLVCTDVDGLKEILFDNESAFFISKNDKFSLSDFFSNKPNREEYNKVLYNLSELAPSLDKWSDSAGKYLKIFNSLKYNNAISLL